MARVGGVGSIDDGKRLSIVSRAAPTRPGVVPVSAFGVSSAIGRRRSRRFLSSASSSLVLPHALRKLAVPLRPMPMQRISWPFSSCGTSFLLQASPVFSFGGRTARRRSWVRGWLDISLPLLLLAREVLLLAHSLRLRVLPVFIDEEFFQRFSAPSAIVGAVQSSFSSRRRRQRIFFVLRVGRRSRGGSF